MVHLHSEFRVFGIRNDATKNGRDGENALQLFRFFEITRENVVRWNVQVGSTKRTASEAVAKAVDPLYVVVGTKLSAENGDAPS